MEHLQAANRPHPRQRPTPTPPRPVTRGQAEEGLTSLVKTHCRVSGGIAEVGSGQVRRHPDPFRSLTGGVR